MDGWNLAFELLGEETEPEESLVPAGLTPSAPYADACVAEVDIEELAGACVNPTSGTALRRPA